MPTGSTAPRNSASSRSTKPSTLVERSATITREPIASSPTATRSEQEIYPYDRTSNSEGRGGFSEDFIVPEHALIDQVHLLGSFMDTFAVPFQQWYAALRASRKELAVLEHSRHRPLLEQPQRFVTFMTDTVLAHTAKAQR